MNEFVYKLTLDLNCAKTPPVICSGQFDKGRKFEFTITANGEPYDVTGCSATLKGVRSNGSNFAVECSVSDGKIIKTLDDTTLSEKGKTVAKLVISDSSKNYSTQKFIIDVDSALEGDITVADDYSILNRLIEQIHALNESGAILVDDTIDKDSNNAVANSVVATALETKADKTTTLHGYGITDAYTKVNADRLFGCHTSVTFDENYIPLTFVQSTKLTTGSFATGNEKIKYVYISSIVTTIDSGTFAGCTNLTEVYFGGEDNDKLESLFDVVSADVPTVEKFVILNRKEISDLLIQVIVSINNNKANDIEAEHIINKASVIDFQNVSEEKYPNIKGLYDYHTHYVEPCYDDIDNLESGKLDNTAGSVATDNIADKAVTSAKIANGAVTALKLANGSVSSSTIATNQINTAHLQSGAVTSDKLADEVNTSINGKYDSANVETGSGTFNLSDSDSELINSPSFEYQCVGNVVTLSLNATSNAVINTPTTVSLNNLPYICKTFTSGNFVTNANEECSFKVGTGTNTLTLNLSAIKAVGIRIAVTFSYIKKS